MLMNIEEYYQKFYQKNLANNNAIDFIGINVLVDTRQQYLFKTYQHIGTIIEQFDPFLTLLKSKNMIKNYIPIITSDKNRVQYDVRLDNRNNDNMSEVLACLFDYLPLKDKFLDLALSEIYYLTKMNITEIPQYDMSALYFLGLQWNKGILSALKLHFITRKVNNPNNFSDGFWYDNDYFLAYFKASKNKLCKKISIIVENFLNQLEGQLWMFGIDILMDSDIKYKIYLQNKNGFNLEKIFRILNYYSEFDKVCVQLYKLNEWLVNHPELLLYGFAITVTTQEIYGLNLYFIPPFCLRGTT